MKIYFLKSDQERSKCLMVPYRSGSRFMEKVYKSHQDKFFKVIDMVDAGVNDHEYYIENVFLDRVHQKHSKTMDVYIPMRTPYDQYCSCLRLLTHANLPTGINDTTSWAKSLIQNTVTMFQRYKDYLPKNRSVFHLENDLHNRPTAMIPVYLSLAGFNVHLLELSNNELNKFVEDNIGPITTESSKDVTGYQTRKSADEEGSKLFDFMLQQIPELLTWLNFYTAVYDKTSAFKDKTHEYKIASAFEIYMNLRHDEVFKKVCAQEYELMLKYKKYSKFPFND